MIVALIDNGSLEPAAHRNLRAVAAALSGRVNTTVHAISWKHSDRVPVEQLDQTPAWTLAPFVRSLFALGQREFVFVPFFISAQGAIGSALRSELEALQHELGAFEFHFTEGLAARGVIPTIVVERIRAVIAHQKLQTPPVIVVDHGGPSAKSAALRDRLAAQIRLELKDEIGAFAAASMEGAHPPLLADQLRAETFAAGRDIVVAPLFLSPGRHAGQRGDLAEICRSAHARCHLAELVGTHPRAIDALADALRTTLSTLHAESLA
jgi:sirohydrochlorin ferrochelatase